MRLTREPDDESSDDDDDEIDYTEQFLFDNVPDVPDTGPDADSGDDHLSLPSGMDSCASGDTYENEDDEGTGR